MYTNDGPRLYVTADDKVVQEGDPAAVRLLVGEGGQLSDEDAAQYGLTQKPEKAKAEQPNKAKSAAENKAAK